LCRALPGYDPAVRASGFRFDAEAAGRAIDWIETHCRHIKGALAGQYLRLLDWQRAVVANLFGWVGAEDGARRYRRCLVYVPRKNAKTTLAAAIALYVFLCDDEPGAEIYSAAAKRDQAKIVWRIARTMTAREPTIDGLVKRYQASMVRSDDEEAYFQPLASEGKSEHGNNAHVAIIDELHAQGSPDLLEAITTSMGGRSQPLLLMLTTADAIGESVCNEQYTYAKQVRDNRGDLDQPGYDPAFLPVIYEASREDDWTDEAVWRKANPMFDVVPTIRSTLRDEVRRAKDQPGYANAFRRWYLNVQVETATAWLSADDWDKCAAPVPTETLGGATCYAAIDLSSTDDMTALVLYFPDGRYVLPFYWVPEEAAKRRHQRNDPLYLRWAASGHLTLTPGNRIDHDLVLEQLDAVAKTYKVAEVGIDPANAARVSHEIQKRGHALVEVRQGWATLSDPAKALYAMLGRGELKHGGHPVLRWNALNAQAKVDERGNLSIVKPRGAAKVDGLVCVLMCLRRAMENPEPVSQTFDQAAWLAAEPLEM
jgi:phage terminase large subunit-like protein